MLGPWGRVYHSREDHESYALDETEDREPAAYIGSVWLAHPEIRAVLRGTIIPTIHLNREFLTTLVAVGNHTPPYHLYI
jgi:hypothetical protein